MAENDGEDAQQKGKFVGRKMKRHERAQSASQSNVDDNTDDDEDEDDDDDDGSKNSKNQHSDNTNNNNNRHPHKRHPQKESEVVANTYAQMAAIAKNVAKPKNQQQQLQQKYQQENLSQHIDEVADSNGSSGSSNNSGEEGSQADYSITYFGILANSSKKEREKALVVQEQEEEQAELSELLPLNTSENSAKTTDSFSKIADSDDAARSREPVHATRNQQQQKQQQLQQKLADAPSDGAGESYGTHFSAFERYKAQRRNSRRYGHKMYKKKYKDYLNYATISSLTARARGAAMEATTTTKAPEISTALSAVANATATSAKHTNNAIQAKLTNSSYNDYYRKQESEQEQRGEPVTYATAQKHAEKLRKYARKIEAEISRGLPASPIFVVGNRSGGASGGVGANPFYEGQINYYLQTRDDDDDTEDTRAGGEGDKLAVGGGDEGKENADAALVREREERLRAHGRSMERMIAADHNNWYRRVSPVLRNGIKVLGNEGKYQHGQTAGSQQDEHKQQNQPPEQQQHAAPQHQHQHQHQHTHHHQRNHFLQHHQHQHQQQHHRRQHAHMHTHANKQQTQHGIHSHRRGGGGGNHHKHRQHSKHYQSTDRRQHQQEQQKQHTTDSHQHKLPASALDPPSPHASATQAAVELGMVQTPIPPPSYIKQHQQETVAGTVAGTSGSGALQLGHQITDLEEFERYYAKWPHLARVQFQVYDEHYREAHPELYPEMKGGVDDENADADEDYDDDYESAAELEEAQSGHDEDANLPPYIKKYNRRNKQLLNLLEGTLPPPTRPPPALMRSWSSSMLQPGPHASSRSAGGGSIGRVRIDDDYLKEKRKRYHNRDISSAGVSSSSSSANGNGKANRKDDPNRYEDLFAPQRDVPATTSEATRQAPAVSANREGVSAAQKLQNDADVLRGALEKVAQSTNQLPDDDVSISRDTETDTDSDIASYAADDGDVDIWPKEIENKSNANKLAGSAQMTWQIEKLTTPNPLHAHHTTVAPSSPKAAIFRLPSYPAIAGSFIGKPRSRSAQFAPSGGSRGKLAFIAPASYDLHGNRWSNIYGSGGGGGGGGGGVGSSNGLGINGNHHKSLSRFSAYKPNVHKTLTAAAALSATRTTAPPPFMWHAAGDGMGGGGADLADTTTATAVTATPSSGSSDEGDGIANGGVGRTISSFVYHRVIDASPRLVGTGATGRKQRLPFVAITDRRLETTRKALLERQKDFEQNHYPMP
ncbi:PREDICTED: uncharacterized protein LOC108369276 isoform X1 [Rhagoletis zephyria]|uniref:uncharacterized protein LOC108369276 isoform X1 n=1 Tax=Rhagoletis zephyria TaxID=28612 RepID=UPI000811A3F8|nr:PREDICTED: uncharacterized protein LOC108369276 isoform X1 [Rhagoletis zephyria]